MAIARILALLFVGGAVVMAVAKSVGASGLSWGWVLAPLWVPIMGFAVFCAGCVVLSAIAMGGSRRIAVSDTSDGRQIRPLAI